MQVFQGMIDIAKAPFSGDLDTGYMLKLLALFVALAVIFAVLYHILINVNTEITP